MSAKERNWFDEGVGWFEKNFGTEPGIISGEGIAQENDTEPGKERVVVKGGVVGVI